MAGDRLQQKPVLATVLFLWSIQQELQEFERKVGGKRRKPRKVAVNDDQDHPWWKQQSWLIVIGSVLFILGSLVLYMYMVE